MAAGFRLRQRQLTSSTEAHLCFGRGAYMHTGLLGNALGQTLEYYPSELTSGGLEIMTCCRPKGIHQPDSLLSEGCPTVWFRVSSHLLMCSPSDWLLEV